MAVYIKTIELVSFQRERERDIHTYTQRSKDRGGEGGEEEEGCMRF